MSWHFSQALVEGYSEATCSDGEPSAPSKSTPTPAAYYWPDKTTGHSRLSRFGMTSEPLTGNRGAELLMWFRAGFPARTSASQERGKDSPARDPDCGKKCGASFARYDHDARMWRTHQCSLLGGLDEYSATWPKWGSMRNGECWEPPMSALPTFARESGLSPTPSGNWPTPTTADAYTDNLKSSQQSDGSMHSVSLAQAVQMYPTPTARDYRSNMKLETVDRRAEESSRGVSLSEFVQRVDRSNGRLNPDWVEWLMGWPIGWTALNPLATARFREWQQQHGGH